MSAKPIRTDTDHEQTLTRIDELMGSEYGSPEGDELDALVTLAESWEDEHYPMGIRNHTRRSSSAWSRRDFVLTT